MGEATLNPCICYLSGEASMTECVLVEPAHTLVIEVGSAEAPLELGVLQAQFKYLDLGNLFVKSRLNPKHRTQS